MHPSPHRRSTSDGSEACLTPQALQLLLISLLCQEPRVPWAEPEPQAKHQQRQEAAMATGFTWGLPGLSPRCYIAGQAQTLTLFHPLSGSGRGRHVQREENRVQRDALGLFPLPLWGPWLQRWGGKKPAWVNRYLMKMSTVVLDNLL